MPAFHSRSMGLKLMVVCGLALSMTVPGLIVGGLIDERSGRAAEVTSDISRHAGGAQTFLGPTLAIPYTGRAPGENNNHYYLIFPAAGSAEAKIRTEQRRRSLFQVPVYQAEMKLDASFDLTQAPATPNLDWDHAELIVGVSDARGALSDGVIAVDGKAATLSPAEIAPDLVVGERGALPDRLTLLGTRMSALAKPGARFEAVCTLRFSGAQRIALLPYARTTRIFAQGDWPDPGFDGAFPPVRRSVAGSGFTAEWSAPFIARGVPAEGAASRFIALDAAAIGISFIEVADAYQAVSRSMKYVLLFLALVFLTYFVFEATTGTRVHPAQYLLVGLAQIVFYLLLLSLAERLGFDWAFLFAGGATVTLLSVNAGWVFAGRSQAVRGFAIFGALYGLIYLLLRMEDNALLTGALASFAALSAAMYLTRRIDWYGSGLTRPAETDSPGQSLS